jgi:hypothetical protein
MGIPAGLNLSGAPRPGAPDVAVEVSQIATEIGVQACPGKAPLSDLNQNW